MFEFAAAGSKCSFDSGYCSWSSDSKSDFVWPRQKGAASSGDLASDHSASGSMFLSLELFLSEATVSKLDVVKHVSVNSFIVQLCCVLNIRWPHIP